MIASDSTPAGGTTRVADQVVFMRLVEMDFRGPWFERFAEECVRYAEPVLRSWIASGEIFNRMSRKVVCGRYALVDPCQPADVDYLVQDTLADALHRFAEQGRAGTGWSVKGGASLATYFMGACLIAFPGVYRSWLREERRFRQAKGLAAECLLPVVPDHADLAVCQLDARDVLDALDESDQVLILLGIAGYSRAEIGRVLGVTARAAEGLLYRLRQKLRESGLRGDSPTVPAPVSA